MKNILTIAFIFALHLGLFSQTGDPFTDQVRTRVTELPTTHPIRIAIDPVKATPPVPGPPQTIDQPQFFHHDSIRNIYWIHGFGGNQDRWTDASEATGDITENKQGFMARIVDGVVAPAYRENGGLYSGAQDVANEIESTTGHQSDAISATNYLIGHSQGGIVGRYMISQDECGSLPFPGKSLYGGLVTFSSALNGAQIVNSRVEGKMNDLIVHSCGILTDNLGSFVKFILKKIDGSIGPEETLCETLTGSLVPILFSGLNANISLDYKVGSSVVSTMNDCIAGEISKVAFYGVEPYTPLPGVEFANPIFYRTVQHFFTEVNTHPTWEANDDSELAITFSNAAINQRMKAKQKDKWGTLHLVGSLGIPGPSFFQGLSLQKQARAHRRVSNLYHNMGDFWLDIIGALTTVNVVVGQTPVNNCVCQINQGTYISTTTIPGVTSESECNATPNSISCSFSSYMANVYEAQQELLPSDGVVLQESAQHMVGATFPSQRLGSIRYLDTGIPNEPDTGSSHMQARNDRNTRDALRALYDGELGPFFQLEIQD